MKNFTFELKTKMIFGRNESLNLGKYLEELNYKNVVFVVDKNVYFADHIDKIYDSISPSEYHTLLYEYPGEPTYELLDSVFFDNQKVFGNLDAIVAIGGGSVIDFAKGLAVLSTNLGPSIQYRGFPTSINKPIPVVALPTTAGTGSEVTYNAVFIDSLQKKKLGINTKLNFPVLAILDPYLIISCPERAMLSAGFDALVHAVESYGATKSNEVSRMFSKKAFNYLYYGLIDSKHWDVLDEEKKLAVAERLQLGAYNAGIALINSGSGPSGAMSYILGTQYDVPHGLAGAVFLPHIIEHNRELGFRYCDFNDEEINFSFIYDWLKFDYKNLHQFGVRKDNSEPLFRGIETLQPAFDQNPVLFTVDDAKNIIRGMI